jgi:ribonucleotide reductase alpha subunit
VTGLADMLAMLGVRYGGASSLELTRRIMATIRDTAYRTSIEMAQEKGPFPEFDKLKYGASPFVLNLSHELQDAIAQHGIRNSHLLAVAPSGTISRLANNVSGGIGPLLSDTVSPQEQLRIASVVQSCVDGGVATTVRLPPLANSLDLELTLLQAWELGLKGCAVHPQGNANA